MTKMIGTMMKIMMKMNELIIQELTELNDWIDTFELYRIIREKMPDVKFGDYLCLIKELERGGKIKLESKHTTGGKQ